MKKTEPTPSIPSGVFVSTLSAMHGGKVLADIDDALREVTRAVNDTTTKGKLIIELTITPNGVGVGDTPLFSVSENIKTSIPKKARAAQSFFADDDCNLTRRDPNQTHMNLTIVPGDPLERTMPATVTTAKAQ